MKRHRTISLIAALVLIPLFLGLIPINMAHKLASGTPSCPVKQTLRYSSCLFDSVTSHAEPAQVAVVEFSFAPPPATFVIPLVADGEVIHSIFPDISPLRC